MHWHPIALVEAKTWLKTKCFTESTFVVVGTDRDRKTGALRALLAHPDSEGLSYAGAAFIALGGDERAQFLLRSSVSPRLGLHLSRHGCTMLSGANRSLRWA